MLKQMLSHRVGIKLEKNVEVGSENWSSTIRREKTQHSCACALNSQFPSISQTRKLRMTSLSFK